MGSTCPIIHKRNGIIPLSSWVQEELVSFFCWDLLLGQDQVNNADSAIIFLINH